MERTFLMIKPDGVEHRLVGEIISRIEKKGMVLSAMKIMQIDVELAKKHYNEHVNKPFFDSLVSFITSGPVVAMIIEGEGVVSVIRTMVGVTDPKEANPGTIRGDFATEIDHNIVHASDSNDSAKREIELFFG